MNNAFVSLVKAAIERLGVQSAAIFIIDGGSDSLELAAAAGVEGEALERLAAAVRNEAHPIARTLTDATASFDVAPVAPGGPALRSHLPLLVEGSSPARAVGVLAVAHERNLSESDRRALTKLAEEAALLANA